MKITTTKKATPKVAPKLTPKPALKPTLKSRPKVPPTNKPVPEDKESTAFILAPTSIPPNPISTANTASKQSKIIELLRHPKGAGIQELMDATGWQAHSVRGFLSGTIKKKLRLALISQKQGGGLRYRIAS